MRKTLLIFATLCLLVALSACKKPAGDRVNQTSTHAPLNSTITSETTYNTSKSTTKGNLITREQSIEKALQKAGLSRDNVYDLEAELDRERNGLFWEVDFETREHEYSYDIHAETGKVTKIERERNY